MPRILLVLFGCVSATAASPPDADNQQWAGAVTFFQKDLNTVSVPLNVTVTGGAKEPTASFTFYFTKYGGALCRIQAEPFLQWATTAGVGTAVRGQ